ncbi:hypothetical protein Tco_1234183 [Tanacetum coccineum]
MHCPIANSFNYTSTLCACKPGFLYNISSNICSRFAGDREILVGTGVDYSINFPDSILSFDSIKKYTQSQSVFLGATLVMIVSWFMFCFLVRFGSVGDGRTYWFKADQKYVKKRKTELGGAFSIASVILFIGLFAALLYQVISKRTVEVHSVRAANAPDLTSFTNDMEFNITTISTMTCSNLRGLGTLLTGKPGFLDFRTAPLSTFANFSCQNTTNGPMVSLKCDNCQLIRDNLYTSWQFIDLPSMPASAVGFEFNLTARDRRHRKHRSFVSGVLKNDAKLVTFRGNDPNILEFNLFPRIYRNKHDLKLIQPLFHEFLPGSYFDETNELRASLQSSSNGLVNITLHVSFLLSYIIEVDNQNVLGPVGFLADLGGLYCVSVGIFFYLLVQFEYRFKKFRHEDKVMRRIRNRRKAQDRWDKLRKYVLFTWGRGSLSPEDETIVETACCSSIIIKSHGNEGSSRSKRKHPTRKDTTISLNTKLSRPNDKVLQKEEPGDANNRDAPRQQPLSFNANDIPMPPSSETIPGSEISVSEIQKNIRDLYDYNVMLQEELIHAQSMLHTLTLKAGASNQQ